MQPGDDRERWFPVTKNLPEKLADAIPSLSERAALFADPPSLLSMDPGMLRDLAAEVAVEAGPIMKQVRTMVGLVSWALRSKVPAGEFGAWIQSYSELVGVSVRTLHEWRVQATEQVGIIDPYKSKRGPKPAGESGQLAETRESPKVIPAASTEAPAKTSEGVEHPGANRAAPEGSPPPAKKSEGGGSDGLAASTSGSPASAIGHPSPTSGPSSGGAELQLPAEPTDEAAPKRSSSRSALPDPSPAGGKALGEVSPPPADVPDVDVDAIGLRWLKSKTVAQVRAIGDPWGPAIRAEVQRWSSAFGYVEPVHFEKPQRRQGTITRPQAAVLAGRAITAPNGSLSRRTVEPMFKGGK